MDAARITRLVALVVITLATMTFVQAGAQEARAGGGCRGVPVTEAEGDTVTMLESCFEPSVLRVEPGQEVTFLNTSGQPHNVAGQNTSWGSYEERLTGESVTHRFEQPGTYAYYCMFHPGMVGVLVVGDGKGALTGSVSRVDGPKESLLASVPQADPEPDLVASSTDATRSASDDTDWLALAGVAVVGAVVGGGGIVLARRR